MAMKHERNIENYNSFECFSPQRYRQSCSCILHTVDTNRKL